ncbi:unnamed protein product [Hymenolepis diminuta]|nr:unnamed protein product [Hymenolepis diminuta]
MQEIYEIKRHAPDRLQQRFSLILEDLKYQLDYLDDSTSVSQSTSDIAHIRTDSFSKIDICRHWVIPYPIDDYAEEPQERCSECDAELDNLCQFYRTKALCSQCYMNTEIVAVCNACHQVIEGLVLKALGKTWHPHHLVCSKCEMNLSGGPFYEENGEPLCFHHFRSIKKEVCHKCQNLLPEGVVEFSNKLYCPEHFNCEFCDSPLKSG